MSRNGERYGEGLAVCYANEALTAVDLALSAHEQIRQQSEWEWLRRQIFRRALRLADNAVFDFRLLLCEARVIELAGRLIWQIIKPFSPQVLVGPGFGAAALLTSIALAALADDVSLSILMVRDKRKGYGNDTIRVSGGNNFIVAGGGNDTIDLGGGAGRHVIAFNKGDGYDTLVAGPDAEITLSLGGGITYHDLSYARSGNDLKLNTGKDEGIVFRDWYLTAPERIVPVNLQIMADAMAGFSSDKKDSLLNQRIEDFDFSGLANSFEVAEQSPLSYRALSSALLENRLAASDSEALGGDLAYQYGTKGSLSGIGLNAAQTIVGSPDFGSLAQSLKPLGELQAGAIRL